MSNVSSLSIAVNPALAVRRPATMPRSAVMLGRARDPISGRFVAGSAAWGLQTVMLPTGVVAYRVGPTGVIYADLATAKRNAAVRRPGHLAPPEPARAVSPVVYRGWDAPAVRMAAKPRPFAAGLGVDVDADDIRFEAMAADFAAMEAICSGLAAC